MIYSDQDLPASNQSLRILSNLVAAGVFSSIGQIDELISELLSFIRSILAMNSAEVFDLLTKVHHLFNLLVSSFKNCIFFLLLICNEFKMLGSSFDVLEYLSLLKYLGRYSVYDVGLYCKSLQSRKF
jgi:hypothetical protein